MDVSGGNAVIKEMMAEHRTVPVTKHALGRAAMALVPCQRACRYFSSPYGWQPVYSALCGALAHVKIFISLCGGGVAGRAACSFTTI